MGNKMPVMVFDNKSLKKCLKYWKKKLFLQDWTIKVKLVSPKEMENEDLAGLNQCRFVNKSSVISIQQLSKEDRICSVAKACDEQTLVHELLHCKYNFMESDSGSYETMYVDAIEHQKLDELSKTLIMVKYDLPFDWFRNFKYESPDIQE